MSEAERLRRQEYKRNRKRWILIQTIALVLVAAFSLTSFLVYDRMNSTYYIEYTENGNVDYKVYLKENNFFDEEYIGSGQSYVASLIKEIGADFAYKLKINGENVGFEYSYRIDAQLIVANKDTGDHIFDPVYEIVPETKESVSGRDTLSFGTNIRIDYNHYNKIANDFIKAYELKSTSSTLVVTMNVKVLSTCNDFKNESNENAYFTSLHIPLTEPNFSMFTTSSNPSSESKVLACTGRVSQDIFLALFWVFASLAVLQIVLLTVFVFITKNEDVNYTNKIRKIVSSYRSFIQQMEGQFDVSGYQIVPIKTFKEMLNIRDTIQSPILMFENVDQTVTEFVIPTSTQILYMFEIKVDNYDDIYGAPEEPEEDEVVIINTEIPDEVINEALATPDVVLEEINYVEDNDVDYDGTEEDPGIEVIGVVWPEREKRNKVYRYDPNGEVLEKGDVVLVPTRDAIKDREVIRKAAVAHGNHKIDPSLHPHKIKKIIGVIKRHVETALASTPADGEKAEQNSENN